MKFRGALAWVLKIAISIIDKPLEHTLTKQKQTSEFCISVASSDDLVLQYF